jgi:hypothetical protein
MIGLLAIPPMLYVGLKGIQDTRGMLLPGSWVLMMAAPAFQQRGIPAGYLLEVGLVFFSVAACRQVYLLAGKDRDLGMAALLFCTFMLAGLASTVSGQRAHAVAAAWQILYTLKFPLMFLMGLLIVWNDASRRIFAHVVRWSWIPMLLCVALEVAAPGFHQTLFGARPDWHANPMLGFGLRYRGPASHPGNLAIMSALLAACAAVNWMTDGRRLSWAATAAMYGLLILLSGERQEALALLLALLLLAAVRMRAHWPLAACAAVLAAGAGLAWWGFGDRTLQIAALDDWGFGDPLARLSERGILYRGGLDVARQYFPWGAGFGTYGGVGAQKFDLSLSMDLGFRQYWWFRQRLFLVDTYWPSVLAETGVVGFLALAACFVWMLSTLAMRAASTEGTAANALVMYALAALALMLANSPTSIQLTDPRSACLFWLLIGAAWRATANDGTRRKTWQAKSS